MNRGLFILIGVLASMWVALIPLYAKNANKTGNVSEATSKPKPTFEDVLSSDNQFARPLSEVLNEIARRYKIRYRIMDGGDTTGLILPYADSRLRPYSMEESLTNVLAYFDLKWEKVGNSYRIKPYEYMRRYDADGKKLLDYLSSLYHDSTTFDARRRLLKKEFRERICIDRILDRCVANTLGTTNKDGVSPEVELGKMRKMEGYTVQNFSLETLPGLYVCGSIYAPSHKGKHPLIICPNGHFAEGRYNPDLQKRMATLARMGAIVVGWDLFGWGESELQVGRKAHETAVAQPMQLTNGLLIFDWLLKSRKDIDMNRLAVNGGSGGGTHCVMLTLLDDRFTAACPVVSFCSHFDGGCPCESGMGQALCGGGTCNAEYAACFVPKPLGFVTDGGDWTRTAPAMEFPFLYRIYRFYNATGNLTNYHFDADRHDFGPNKRNSVYDFFTKTFHLDASKIDESKVTIESAKDLQMYGSMSEMPASAVKTYEEFQTLLKR